MRKYLVFAILMVLVAVSPADSYAQRGQDRARDAVRSGQSLPLDRILSSVTSRYPGRVLDVKLQRGQPLVYRVKLLGRDGRVRLVYVNARTGKILSVQGGR